MAPDGRKAERFSSISHLIGAVAAMAGLVVLVVLAARQGDPWKIVSFSIYGTTLVLLFAASALYHGFPAHPFLQKLDHYAIYLLIAGTYTPFTLVTLRGAWGWSVFGVIWGLAVVGIVTDAVIKDGRRWLPVVIYLLMTMISQPSYTTLMAGIDPSQIAVGVRSLVEGARVWVATAAEPAETWVRWRHLPRAEPCGPSSGVVPRDGAGFSSGRLRCRAARRGTGGP